MYSIAYLLFKRNANNPSLEIVADPHNLLINSSNLSIVVKGIDSNPTPSEKLILEEIKNIMLRRMPQVQMMTHLGTHLPSLTFFILFLIEDDTLSPDSNLGNKIKDNCRFLANVQSFVHKVSTAKTALEEGKRFWINAFKNGTTIYRNPMVHFPTYSEDIKIDEKKAIKHWNRWGEQGKSFFEGAKFYRDAGNTHLCLFLVHQALAYSLKAFILGTIGYRVDTFNVPRLLRISSLLTNSIVEIIGVDTDQGRAIIELLLGAGNIAKRIDYPDIDPALAETSFFTAEKLLGTIEYLYQKYVHSL